MENKRYEKLNEQLKEWFKLGHDKNILESLYSQANLKESELVDRTEDIREKTMFSDLTDQELLERYEKKYFNRYTNNELKHLFQESHNRFMKDSGIQVTRNVLVKNDEKEKNAIGWVYSDRDLLFMNKYFINRGKENTDYSKLVNDKSIGKIVLKTLLHETKHNIQYEDAIDFALGNEQEKDRAFAGALMIVNNSNFNIAWSKSNEEYERYVAHWQDNYNYHAYEQEANYCSNERIIKYFGKDFKNMKPDYAQALAQNAHAVFRFSATGVRELDQELIDERVHRVVEYAKYQLDYFEKNTTDCPIRERVLQTMHAYIDEDAKGHSALKDRIEREVNEMYDQFTQSIAFLKKQKKSNRTQKLQEEVLYY